MFHNFCSMFERYFKILIDRDLCEKFNIFQLKFRFINFEFDIRSFIAFEAFLRWIALSTFPTTGL